MACTMRSLSVASEVAVNVATALMAIGHDIGGAVDVQRDWAFQSSRGGVRDMEGTGLVLAITEGHDDFLVRAFLALVAVGDLAAHIGLVHFHDAALRAPWRGTRRLDMACRTEPGRLGGDVQLAL